jgi:hypothetical protein
MRERFRYEKPQLVDLRSDSVLGYTVCSGGFAVENCSQGSCIVSAACGNGTEANGCTNGSAACHPSGCTYSCCYAGNSVEGGISTMCWCSGGSSAGYRCETGSRASFMCTATGGSVCA